MTNNDHYVPGGVYPHKPEFYRAGVAILRQRWGAECEVVVLSDDMAWCRNNIRTIHTYTHYTANIKITRRHVNVMISPLLYSCEYNSTRIPRANFIDSTDHLQDLAILSLASHTVIDYGTFGAWVSHLTRDKRSNKCMADLKNFVSFYICPVF